MAPFLILAAIAGALPTLDIPKGCQGANAMAADVNAYQSCLRDEQATKDKLAKGWDQYPAAARNECVSGKASDLDNSYVELLTCIEMQTWKTDPGALSGDSGVGATRAVGGSPPLLTGAGAPQPGIPGTYRGAMPTPHVPASPGSRF
ncbi:MAG TPA: hypothetical protein VKS78_03340 [Roseiarcus sp.]|nr:hypothetical protein [Roseiarcus sp.]